MKLYLLIVLQDDVVLLPPGVVRVGWKIVFFFPRAICLCTPLKYVIALCQFQCFSLVEGARICGGSMCSEFKRFFSNFLPWRGCERNLLGFRWLVPLYIFESELCVPEGPVTFIMCFIRLALDLRNLLAFFSQRHARMDVSCWPF